MGCTRESQVGGEMTRWRFFVFLIMALLPQCARADHKQWGHLSGRFTYDGDPPAVETFRVTRDNAALGDAIEDESLIVHEENRGISNIVVFLLPDRDKERLVHPSYADAANAKVELATEHGRFTPHILLLRTSQTMIQCNKDKVGHNANIQFFRNSPG
jgi:hypothetical protein